MAVVAAVVVVVIRQDARTRVTNKQTSAATFVSFARVCCARARVCVCACVCVCLTYNVRCFNIQKLNSAPSTTPPRPNFPLRPSPLAYYGRVTHCDSYSLLLPAFSLAVASCSSGEYYAWIAHFLLLSCLLSLNIALSWSVLRYYSPLLPLSLALRRRAAALRCARGLWFTALSGRASASGLGVPSAFSSRGAATGSPVNEVVVMPTPGASLCTCVFFAACREGSARSCAAAMRNRRRQQNTHSRAHSLSNPHHSLARSLARSLTRLLCWPAGAAARCRGRP